MSYTIIDRRKNPHGKSTSNRQRFLKRTKEQLRKSVKEKLLDRSITSDDDQAVSIPTKGIQEPSFNNDPSTGDQEFVVPGNEDLVPGDLIEKPKEGQGGEGREGSDNGEGEDEFSFVLTKDEYYDILFEDMELPDLDKKSQKEAESYDTVRTGYTNDGNPSQLDLVPTMRKSLGRRIALKNPKLKELEKLKEELKKIEGFHTDPEDSVQAIFLRTQIEALEKRVKHISYIDPIDLRFRNYDKIPNPKHQAVMFCVMDVSASMSDHHKDLAKRFYLLLYLFLQRQYKKVDVVFIRHHTTAKECNEEDFFYSKESGGTLVSSGFELMSDIVTDRYPESEWNIYCAQASDGDNFGHDNDKLTTLLEERILPMVQFMAYIEVQEAKSDAMNQYYQQFATGGQIWGLMNSIAGRHPNLETKQVDTPADVYTIFGELFNKAKKSNV